MFETKEQALIEQLVTHAAVEAFDIAVLHCFCRRDVVPLDLVILRPWDGIRGHFGPIVGDNHVGLIPSLDERRQLACYTATRYRYIRDRRQAFARNVVDHIEDAETPASRELTVEEIQRPAGCEQSVICILCEAHDTPQSHRVGDIDDSR